MMLLSMTDRVTLSISWNYTRDGFACASSGYQFVCRTAPVYFQLSQWRRDRVPLIWWTVQGIIRIGVHQPTCEEDGFTHRCPSDAHWKRGWRPSWY